MCREYTVFKIHANFQTHAGGFSAEEPAFQGTDALPGSNPGKGTRLPE
jgi:hypothetical protein